MKGANKCPCFEFPRDTVTKCDMGQPRDIQGSDTPTSRILDIRRNCGGCGGCAGWRTTLKIFVFHTCERLERTAATLWAFPNVHFWWGKCGKIGWAPEAAREREEGEWGCVLASISLSALALYVGLSHQIE